MTQKANNQAIKPVKELTEQELTAQIALTGNLAGLSPEQQMTYYARYCQHLGLDPITRPFDLLTTFEENGSAKTILYASASCSSQLADKRQVTYGKPETEFNKELGILTVRVEAMMYIENNRIRSCWRSGVAHIEGLKGKRLENAIKKAETQAHRRATLALCGIAMPDESEVEDIQGSQTSPVEVNSATGPIYDKIGELLRAQKLEDSSGARRFVLDGIFRGAYQAVGQYLNISPETIRDLAKKAGVINPQAQAHSEIQDDLTAAQEKIADLQNQRKPEPKKTSDPTPGLAPTLTAAQQRVSDAGMSAWKEHGKDKATVLHLISQYVGRAIKRSADLTDDEAEKVFGYLQTCATQWAAEKEQNNQVIKYDPKNRAHGAAAGKELDGLVLKLAMLGVKTPDLEQLIAGLAYNELGREIENRFALNNEECAAMNELLKAEIAKLEAQKAAEQAKQQILELAAEENAPDFG